MVDTTADEVGKADKEAAEEVGVEADTGDEGVRMAVSREVQRLAHRWWMGEAERGE